MALTATFAADFSAFEKSIQGAQVHLQVFDRETKKAARSLTRDLESISGQKVAAEAARMAEAVKRLGGEGGTAAGLLKLTDTELRRVEASLAAATEKAAKLGEELPDSLKQVNAEIAKLPKPLEETNRGTGLLDSTFGKLTASFAAANVIDKVVSGLFRVGAGALESAGELVDLSGALQVSVGRLQEWQAVAKLGGVELTDLTKAAFTLGDALMGGGRSVVNAVGQLGVSFEKLRMMKPEDQLDQILIAADRLGPSQERNTALVDLFGTKGAMQLARVVDGYEAVSRSAVKSSDAQTRALAVAGDEWDKFIGDTMAKARGFGGDMVLLFKEIAKGSTPVQGMAGGEFFPEIAAQDELRAAATAAADAKKAAAAADAKASQDAILLTRNYITELHQLQKAVDEVVKARGAELAAAVKVGATEEEITRRFGLSAEAQRLYSTATKEHTKDVSAAARAAAKLADEEKRVADERRQGIDALVDDLTKMDAVLANAQEKEDTFWKEWAKDAREARFVVAEEINAIDQAIQKLTDRKLDQMDWVSQLGLLQNFTTDPSAGMKAGKSFGKMFTSGIGDALGDVPGIIQNVLANGNGMREAAVALASRFGQAFGGAIGEYFGGPVGKKIGEAVGALAGPALDKVIGVFTGPSAQADIAKRVRQSYGVSISEGLAKAIADVAASFGGNRQAAEIFSLDKIIGEAGGLNASNLDKMVGKLRDVFVMLQTGAFTSAQAVHVLDENWQSFVDAGTDASGRLAPALVEIIRLTKELGIESKAIRDYQIGQAGAALSGANAVINASKQQFDSYQRIADAVKNAQQQVDALNKVEERGRGVEWQREMAAAQEALTKGLGEQHAASEGAAAELENLGRIAMGTYAAAIEAGMSHNEALRAAAPGLTQLIKAYENLGLNVEDAGLKAFLAQAKFVEANPEILAGIDGLAASMTALSNIGLLNADTFAQMQQAGLRMYERLLAEAGKFGLEGDEAARAALVPMQEYLRQAAEQAELLGVPLDENTQKLIDQSKSLGLWKDKGKEPMEEMRDAVLEMKDAVKELVDALKGIPPRVTSDITTRYHTEGQPPSGSGPGPTSGPQPTGGPSGASLNNAGRSAGDRTITVPVYIDGRQVAMAVAPHRQAADRRWGV